MLVNATMLRPIRRLLRPVKKAFVKPKLDREFVAKTYLSGSGIEIGALHNPLKIHKGASVKYVDRMSEADLRTHYPELVEQQLVHVDIIDDGEQLRSIAADSQQFVIANHFLEHCQDPIAALKNMIRVTRPGGVIYLAVPDRRYTFDVEREVTPIDHFFTDHADGGIGSRDKHFSEWVQFVTGLKGEAFDKEKKKLLEQDYSIHFHTWTLESFVQFLEKIHDMAGFELEFCMQNDFEILSVLRKKGEQTDAYRKKKATEGLKYLRSFH